MFTSLEERNLAIIETIMLELGISDIEELPAKVHELVESRRTQRAADGYAKTVARVSIPIPKLFGQAFVALFRRR